MTRPVPFQPSRWVARLRLRLMAVLAALTVLAACQEAVYSDLTEADANEMVALLALSGVPATRERVGTGGFSVMIEEADIPVAVTMLRNAGLPRERFDTLGDVFGDVGIVGTPFEERVRFAHATNQELAATITQIKGVERARVHVVIPAEGRFGTDPEPARAAIAVFHDTTFEPADYSARIKALVSFSVPRLEIEDIAISYFLVGGFVVRSVEAPPPILSASASEAEGPVAFLTSAGSVYGVPVSGIAMALAAVVLMRLLQLIWRGLRRPRAARRG